MPLKKIPNWLIWSIAIISFAGLLDATYLTVSHYTGSELSCKILEGCNEVANSKYSMIFGIPIALFGVLYYLVILLSILLHYDTKNRTLLSIIPLLTTAGFLFTLYLLYLQIFVIKAVCIYCMFSALTSTALFILSLFIFKYKKQLE